MCVCVSSPSGAFYAARSRSLTPLLASMGHVGVTSMTAPTPTSLISN